MSSVLPRRVSSALLLAASLYFAGAATAPAKTLYVSPSGSDWNAGTITAPLKTLNKAHSLSAPGDNVIMRAGTYGALNSTTRITRAGTASAPITYSGYPGDARPAIIGHMKISASYTRFRGLLFDGPTGRVKSLTLDNPTGEQVQVAIDGATTYGVEISNSEIRHLPGQRLQRPSSQQLGPRQW